MLKCELWGDLLRRDSNWHDNLATSCALKMICSVLFIAFALFLASANSVLVASALEKEVLSGHTYTVSAKNLSQEDAALHWTASDGSPANSSSRSFRWTAPIVDSPRNEVISLKLTNNYGCTKCYNDSIQLLIIPAELAKIAIKKDCKFTAPVYIGDTVTYTYNVTNDGVQPLKELNITDKPNWGPDCLPVYVKGDNGNGLLDPKESWWYECSYIVTDPSHYAKLHTMASESSSSQIAKLMSGPLEIKDRLEIVMANLRLSVALFDERAARLDITHGVLGSENCTYYNYSNMVTGEVLSKVVDANGRLNKIILVDPITGAVFTMQYDFLGILLSEEIYYPPPSSKEYLKIEYNTPYKDFKTFTIIDYKSGDTLVLVFDRFGNIIDKEYKITPGYRTFEERYFLKNIVTVAAKTLKGNEVYDSDSFTLEVFLPKPNLHVTKTAQPEPASPGGLLNYSVVYQNNGGADAHDVVLKETYNRSITFLWSDPAPDDGTVDQWSLGDLKRGESGRIHIQAKVSALAVPGSEITNQVVLTSREDSMAISIINTTVAGNLLNITKSASADLVPPGEYLTYTIMYRNEGSKKQTNVTIHDWTDQYADLVDSKASPSLINGCIGHYCWWHRGDLDPGDWGTITIKVKVKDAIPRNVSKIINTYRINSTQFEGKEATLETAVIHSLWILKTADKSAYNREDNITYTINYGNSQSSPAHNVNVTDFLPEVNFISASPLPSIISGNKLTWIVGTLEENESSTIKIVVQIPKKAKANFYETSLVQGDGYAYVRKGFSTEEKKDSLINRAEINGTYGIYPYPASSYSTVTILGATGTSISSLEHGSGYYKEKAKSSLHQENKSISLEKELFAKYRMTAFLLPRNRSLNYDLLWSDRTGLNNRILGDCISEKYLYTDTLNKNSSFLADMNQTVYKSETDFSSGMAQIRYKKHASNSSAVIQEIDENYHGSFRVHEALDSYGESVKFSKSGIGKGFVSSDKRVNGLQRSYESGSGYYSSEESSQLGSVDKYTKMLYAPVLLRAGSQNLSYANLWNEGLWTKDAEKDLVISEKILYATAVDKEALMDKSSLSLLGKFNGTFNMRLARGQSLDLDETFVGSYQIDTAISVYTTPRHLYPHVNISKEAIMQDEETVLFLINVSNDGNKMLRPLDVTDYLPEGLLFINSSIRAKANGQIINWTIPSLDIGRMLTIKMMAKVDGEREYYTNVVSVRAAYQESILEASNSTTFETYYQPLPCCPGADSGADSKINATSIFNATSVEGYWGEWKPSPCFNITSNMTECSCQVDAYYDELEKNMTKSCCASNYDVP